ncbi:MAG: DUF3662 and FHA domain-containing protein [Acidimicrobiia bacterium]
MALGGFERRLERLVEGTFARAFRSGLSPLELARRITRVMDTSRSVGVRGRKVVPNDFLVRLSPEDHAQFAGVEDALIRELCDAAREHARDEQYNFMGPISVSITVDEKRRRGNFDVKGHFQEGVGGAGAGTLALPTGESVPLGEYVVTIGRVPESTIVLADPNVSRNHAEIRPHADGQMVIDLGSTNGTLVNGIKITNHELVDGDELRFGNTTMTYYAY